MVYAIPKGLKTNDYFNIDSSSKIVQSVHSFWCTVIIAKITAF